MTNMLPRDRGEQILADHAAGMPVRAIARTYGHSPETIRNYVRGHRTPGMPAARADDFAPFAGYCRQRLDDDPHLRASALLTEVTLLGFRGTRPKFYRALDRHEIRPHPCPDCHVARISGYAPLTGTRQIKPSPLPLPASPVAGETLASFLNRLAAVNRTSPETLLEALPPWFSVKACWHDDRWQHDQLTPWADDAAAQLAAISGTTLTAIKSALPAFGAGTGQPARAATACRLCAAARRIQQPVPVHLPAHYQVCLKHGIWLSGPGTPQFSVSRCPDILAAERQARRLRRRCTAEQLIYARVQATAGPAGSEHTWKRRTTALIESNPRSTTESHPQALFLAAAYPEAISAAATTLASRKTRP
jgi:TniQ